MKNIAFRDIPLGLLLIVTFYIFGSFMLLISIAINPVDVSHTMAVVHGLPSSMGVEILLAVAALVPVLSYGLVLLSRWGFFWTIAYSLYIAGVSLTMGGLSLDQPVGHSESLWQFTMVGAGSGLSAYRSPRFRELSFQDQFSLIKRAQ